MTRPMPGPPEPDTLVQDHPDGGVVATRRMTEADGVPVVYFAYAADKRLTDAECAAEKWRALSSAMFLSWAPLDMLGVEIPADGQLYSVTRPDPTEAEIEAATWERFATHPHAFKETT